MRIWFQKTTSRLDKTTRDIVQPITPARHIYTTHPLIGSNSHTPDILDSSRKFILVVLGILQVNDFKELLVPARQPLIL